MLQRAKWPFFALGIVVLGFALYFFFANQPHLVGTSTGGKWEAHYDRKDRY